MTGARAGMAMSLATFAMAAASAIQAVLYLGRFGTNARTDGFFVAFALYSTFGVFSQSLRLTSVGLLVEPGARMSVRRFAAVLGVLALAVLALTVPASRPAVAADSAGSEGEWARGDGRGAAGIGGGDGAAAVGLGVGDRAGDPWTLRHDRRGLHGGRGRGTGVLLGADESHGGADARLVDGGDVGRDVCVDADGTAPQRRVGHVAIGARGPPGRALALGARRAQGTALGRGGKAPGRLVELAHDCGVVLGRTAIYLAFNLLFVITLAFASRSSAGSTTVLSYAYLFASYLVAGTGMALGMSSIPDLTRQARAQRRALVAATVPRGFRYAMLLVAPALAGLIAAGAPLIHAVLPNSLSLAEVHTLRTFATLLVPWTVAALIVNFLLPVLLAFGRVRLLGALAPALLALHLAATATGTALWGVDGAVGAMWVAPAALAGVLLVSGAGRAEARPVVRELGGDGARFLALAALAFGGGWVVGETLGADLAQAVVAGAVGCGAYLVGLWVVARAQLRVLLSTVVARPAAA